MDAYGFQITDKYYDLHSATVNTVASCQHNSTSTQLQCRRWLIKQGKGKGKAVPLQAWTGSEGSRKLRFPDFVTTAQDGGRLSALRTGRLYPQGNTPGTHFC